MSSVEDAAQFEASFSGTGGESSWGIAGTKLYRGSSEVADLAGVTSGSWLATANKTNTVHRRRLILESTAGTAKITANSLSGREHFAEFHGFAIAVLAVTAKHSPDARINMAGGVAQMIIACVFGAIIAALGVGCMTTEVDSPFLGVMLIALGALLMISLRPWNAGRLEVKPAEALTKILTS